MLAAAIWIGVVLGGVALLGAVEFARSNSSLRAQAEELKAGLPILALFLLIVITGSVAVVFFFLYFLASFWQFSLAAIFMVFVFLVARIRKEQSLGALVAQPGPGSGERTSSPTLVNRVATLAVEVVGAAMLMVFMVPVVAGAFLLFRFFGACLSMIGVESPVFALLLLLAAIVMPYYFMIRRRPPAS